MAAFPKMTLTNAGQALQTKVLAGETLTFTRIALGDGQLNGQPIAPLTALISQKATVEVDSVRVVNTTTAQVAGFFSNADISTGFWWRETGVFAQDPDVGEILYGYTNAGDAGDYIPTVADTRIEKYIFCSIAVANADTVDITIPSSDAFIPISDKGVPGGVATLDSGGKNPFRPAAGSGGPKRLLHQPLPAHRGKREAGSGHLAGGIGKRHHHRRGGDRRRLGMEWLSRCPDLVYCRHDGGLPLLGGAELHRHLCPAGRRSESRPRPHGPGDKLPDPHLRRRDPHR